MKNLKLYFYAFIALFLIGAVVKINVQKKKIEKRDAEIDRITRNNYELMNDRDNQMELVLKEKEVSGKIKIERDSLAVLYAIKPKFITKIVTIDNSTHDTILVPVPAINTGLNTWDITDSGNCFKWAGNALKIGDSLKVERTLFEYNNKTTQTFYKKRPYKFLFIKYGKWDYVQKIDSECGENKIQDITFTK
jgi:hypothetical protein